MTYPVVYVQVPVKVYVIMFLIYLLFGRVFYNILDLFILLTYNCLHNIACNMHLQLSFV